MKKNYTLSVIHPDPEVVYLAIKSVRQKTGDMILTWEQLFSLAPQLQEVDWEKLAADQQRLLSKVKSPEDCITSLKPLTVGDYRETDT